MSIKCITFDLDDTLWAIQPVIVNAEKRFYAWLQESIPEIPAQFTLEQLTAHRHAYFNNYPELHHDLTLLRKNWIGEIVDPFNCSSDLLDQGFDVYWKQRNNVSFFHRAIEVLDYANKNFCTGSITNGNADVDQIGIGKYFDFSLTSAEIGFGKPDPAIFEAAVSQSSFVAEEILHVGDDCERDVEGAARMGMQTVWVNTFNQPWRGKYFPDAQIQNISELPDILEKMR